jgi:hypothetical protein
VGLDNSAALTLMRIKTVDLWSRSLKISNVRFGQRVLSNALRRLFQNQFSGSVR